MRAVLARIAANPTGRIGMALVALILLAGILGPLIAPYPPQALDVANRFSGPSTAHLLGTDQLGRDLFSRLLFGTRIALVVALTSIGIAFAGGTILGIAAAYLSVRLERIVLILFDIVASFPTLVLALAVVALLGPGTVKIVLIIAISLIPHFGRVARAQALSLKNSPFLEAERVLGASAVRMVLVHILPNILGPMVVLASMDIPVVITIEAGLSFLGIGVPPPSPSWGSLLNDGYAYLDQSVWTALFAGLALTAATLGFTLFGEALRDAIDPRLKVAP